MKTSNECDSWLRLSLGLDEKRDLIGRVNQISAHVLCESTRQDLGDGVVEILELRPKHPT